ncbi:helix-turn-helix domain-containing protein [Rothia mucilaginosa]|uniref:helix-turn-helix domain-containing protein n=1 Tax=Rothia mucilaginosa TaxID=43675 RepID=UPI001956D2C9|nr:helix-turn-helix transcriptional regulator [Rothia mucilaginosa]VTY09708.1 Helix-turn-helix [Rothia mucilaginosa]
MTETDKALAAIGYAMRGQRKTQAELSEKLGKSQKYVSYALRGKADLRLSELAKISDWLGVPAHRLLQGETTP